MLIEDRPPAGELGGIWDKVKSVAKGTAKVVTTPHRLAYTHVVKPVAKVNWALTKTALGAALSPLVGGSQPVQQVQQGPACGLFQRISRFFGGNPDCE